MLPNPTEIRTPDFILVRKKSYRLYDLKTVFGKASVANSLMESIGQCNRILLNLTIVYNTRSLAFAINRYFEANPKAIEVLIFKGHKQVSVNRSMATKADFLLTFKRLYER